jgi:murein DD-endopeptidase MepM/ murein hydrolase activator NlpD
MVNLLMKKRQFSLLLVPEDNGQVKQIRISSTHLLIVAVGLCLLLATTAFLATQYVGRVADAVALTHLRQENSYLSNQISLLDSSALEFKTQMADLVEKEKTLRILADLPAIDPDVRKVGVGGQRYEDIAGQSLALRSDVPSLRATLANVEQLLRQAKLEKQSFQEVENVFQESRDRLQHTPTIWPVPGHVSRGFGTCTDPFTGLRRLHEGLDIVNRVGTPVVATAAGKVVERGKQSGYGWMIVLDHGYGFKTAYGHLEKIKVKKGEKVERGQVIATLGNSGRSTGPHLHYEVRVNDRPVNPYQYLLPDIVID